MMQACGEPPAIGVGADHRNGTHIMTSSHQSLGRAPRRLQLHAAGRLQARQGGWLVVDAGRVWLTRDGGSDDHVLAAGGRLWLARGQQVVAEPWQAGEPVALRWCRDAVGDQPRGLAGGLPGLAWAGLARGLRAGAAALAAAARSAEARARRSQGAIASGESMACSGAVQ